MLVSIKLLKKPVWFSVFRIARRDNAKRRHEQKNEEKNNAIRKRASEFKEKEKVRVNRSITGCVLFPLNRNVFIRIPGYHGYVPTIGKAAVWIRMITIMPPLLSEHRFMSY